MGNQNWACFSCHKTYGDKKKSIVASLMIKNFGRHMIGNIMLLVVTSLVIENIPLPIVWQLNVFLLSPVWQLKIFGRQAYDDQKKLNHHMIGDKMLLVTKLVVTKSILSPIMWKLHVFWSSHIFGSGLFN
jgi:hypothetical protein